MNTRSGPTRHHVSLLETVKLKLPSVIMAVFVTRFRDPDMRNRGSYDIRQHVLSAIRLPSLLKDIFYSTKSGLVYKNMCLIFFDAQTVGYYRARGRR